MLDFEDCSSEEQVGLRRTKKRTGPVEPVHICTMSLLNDVITEQYQFAAPITHAVVSRRPSQLERAPHRIPRHAHTRHWEIPGHGRHYSRLGHPALGKSETPAALATPESSHAWADCSRAPALAAPAYAPPFHPSPVA